MKYKIISFFLIFSFHIAGIGQSNEIIKLKFEELSETVKGLNEKVELDVTKSTLQTFIAALGKSHNLNVSIDPSLNYPITANFSDELVKNVLIYLIEEYELETKFTGTIISFSKKTPVISEKIYNITYDSLTKRVSYDLQNEPLREVIKNIVNLTKENIVIDPELKSKNVDGFIKNVDLISALQKLAYTNNLELSKLADSTLILKNKLITKIEEIKPTQSATNAKNTNSTNLAGIELAIEKDVNEQILVSVSANDVPIVDILKSIFDKTKVNFMFFSEPKEKTTIAVKNIPLESLLGFLLSTTDYTFKKSEDVFLFGLRSNEKLREIKVVRLKYRSISDVKSVIPADIAKGVKIDEFPELNAFILSGSDPNIKEVEGLITQIDQPVPVIMIELIIVDVNKTRNLNSGIKVGLSDQPVATKGTILPGLDVTISSSTINSFLDLIGLTNLGRVTPNFYVSLSLLESNGLINISSTPKLSTLNSHEATLSIGETNYYLEQQQNVIGTQNPQTVITNQYKPVNADFSITVNPVLSGDDHITLDVSVNQSQFTGRISPNAPPGQSTRDFQSTIRVKNEEMIVLGGLERTEKSETGEGLPFIARIPIINWFFGNKRKVSNKSKLIIFIKPSIIY